MPSRASRTCECGKPATYTAPSGKVRAGKGHDQCPACAERDRLLAADIVLPPIGSPAPLVLVPQPPPLRLPTASALDLAETCLGSAILDRVSEDSDDATTGTVVHRFLERFATVGKDAASAEIKDEDDRAKCAGINLDAIPPGAQREVAVAYDPETDTGEILPRGEHRAYGDDGRYYGTADLLGRIGDEAWDGDYKTGVAKRRAAESRQLKLLVLASARAAGLDGGRGALLYLRHDGKWWTDEARFDAFDLAEMRDWLLRLKERVVLWRERYEAGRLPPLHAGPWCGHCASRRFCPAVQVPMQLAARGDIVALSKPKALLDAVRAKMAVLTPAEKGTVYEQAKAAETMAEAILKIVRDEARGEPLPLSGGKELREVPWSAWVSSDKAKAEIAALQADLERRGEIRLVVTKQVRPVTARRK